MLVYVYQAGLLCEACGETVKAALDLAGVADNGNSDDYPQPEEASESDIPQHCSRGEDCENSEDYGMRRPVGAFLENPLTDDGVGYVSQQIASHPRSSVVRMWAEFYGI